MVYTCTLRKWNPRPACGTAFSSVHPILSAFGLVPTRDEPAECLPWTRRTGARRTYPLPGYRAARSERRWPIGRTYDDFCLIFGIPSWLMPLRDRSGQRWQPLGKPYVVAATEVCSRFFGTCRELSPVPPPPPSLPLSFFAFWGFPEWNTQDLPSLSLVCPWTIVRSWEHLPFSPLPLSPSLFLSFSLSSLYPLPWVSLDAFVIAGNPFPLFLWCVPGRVCRSWEHLLPLSFLLFLSLFSPYPSLPSGP